MPNTIPDQSQIVWRYMSFSRFMWMLQTQRLWLARVDTLDDEWEMALAGAQLMHTLGSHPINKRGDPPPEETPRERAKRIVDLWRRTTFVSCWSGCGRESHALWRIYCGPNEGVAIRTTLMDLKKVVPRLDVHRVTYREIGVFRQTPTREELVSVKRTAFEYENEIRVVATEDTQDPTLSRGEFGYQAPFSVGDVIHGVKIHPEADQSFFDTVARTVDQFAPKIRNWVGWSDMRQRPPLLDRK
jgi:hypothetical protein